MDLVVFPEYALHGLSMDTNPDIMCTLDGPEVAAFKAGLHATTASGAASRSWSATPAAIPYNSGIIIDDTGELQLYYRKLHPWVPVEPWEPGDLGIPVIDGPKGCKLALIICHDGMFPEMARECAYKGAEIMLRTAGYTAPIREAWRFTNQANAFCNLMVTANVCMCGSDGTFDSMGEAMIVNFDGTDHRARHDRPRRRDHHRRGAARPGARGARRLGRREQHLPARPSRLHRGRGRRAGLPLHLHAGPRRRRATGCRGRTRSQVTDGTRLRLSEARSRRYGEKLPEAAE